jgi:hypothetical protein
VAPPAEDDDVTMPLLLLASLLPTDAPTPPDGVRAEEAELVYEIEGEWEVVSYRFDGIDVTASVRGLHWTFAPGKATSTSCLHPAELGCRMDNSKPMPEIDLISSDGMVSRGICVCTGDRLLWADGGWVGQRPKGLSSEAKSDVGLWTLRRVK